MTPNNCIHAEPKLREDPAEIERAVSILFQARRRGRSPNPEDARGCGFGVLR